MSLRPNKMQRLVRLNQFREELANGVLRHAIGEEISAMKKHGLAIESINNLAAWKSQKSAVGGLDISLYSAVLEHEHYAMLHADKLKLILDESKITTRAAKDKMIKAASDTKVSEKRDAKQKSQAQLEHEKRNFDQISDVWLNNRERAND
jgi:hypothetical protein